MNSGLRTFLTSFVLPALVASAAALAMFQFLLKNEIYRSSADELRWIQEASRLITERYYEKVSPEQLAYDAIRGMASRDRWSGFVEPKDLPRWREENEGTYDGLGFAVYRQGEPLTVLYSFPGSPADQAGLETGDRIIGVDGRDCAELTIEEIIDLIKNGSVNVPVRLRVQPYSAPPQSSGSSESSESSEPAPPAMEVEVVRHTIFRPSVVDPRILDEDRGIAYVRLKSFQDHSTEELRQALTALTTRGMKSLILDLRGNRGGPLDQAIGITSLFVDEGVLLWTEGRAENMASSYSTLDGEALFRGLPLVVLIDGFSASASEIVAGALQDYQRALLVGERSYGKGFVQTQIDQHFLVDGELKTARLKITTSRYFTPAGRSIGRLGRELQRPDDDQPTGLWPDFLIQIDNPEEMELLHLFQLDQEIPDEAWALIEERCPLERRRVTESAGGFQDRQRQAAIEVLAGKRAFNALR